MECKQCGNTGLIINNKYCRCAAGKLLKLIEHPIKCSTLSDPKLIKHDIQVGDWVEREGLVCMVNEIAGEDVRVFSYRSTKGAKVNFKGWVNIATLKPMPLEGFEDYKPMAIDCALLTEDAKWFKQLMKLGVKS